MMSPSQSNKQQVYLLGIELIPQDQGTMFRVTHSGFDDQ